jgi:hypothetical protein
MTASFVNIIPFEPESTLSFHWCEASQQAMWSWYQLSLPLQYLPQEFNDKAKMYLVVQRAWEREPTALHFAVHSELSRRKLVCECHDLCLESPA